ncbi:MAG: DUF3887 domain-containing protein [Dokdonella sp.]
MLIRTLTLALLLGATQAHAAPKKHKPAPPARETAATPDAIDVDAMARAKDAAASTGAPADAPTPSAAPDASAPPATSDAPKEKEAAAPSPADTAPATNNAAQSETSSTGTPPLLAPTPDESERRLASACEARATALLDAAQKADYAGATKDFDAKMHTALPPAKFKQTWESLEKFGTLTARGQTHLAKGDGYIAVTIPLLFEKANLYAQVACGSDGRIAGFYVKPLNVPQS